jgi:hypothetical protein
LLSSALLVLPFALLACSSGSTGGNGGAGGHKTSSATTGSGAGTSSSTTGTTGTGGAGTGGAGTGGSGTGGGTTTGTADVLERGKHPSRAAHYVDPLLTPTAAAKMVLDTSFNGQLQGNVYAQPLYVENGPGGKGTFYVVTESNGVYALSETDGSVTWTKSFGNAATTTGAGCGNISPIGITGTPVIDLPSRTMYFNAATAMGAATTIQKHLIHAISIDDGTEKAGFPVDASTVTYGTSTFIPAPQNERGALLLVNGTLYVPYGGHYGDCAQYRGWVIGIPTANPSAVNGFATGGQRGGGMWAAGGLASDGTNIYGTTGNTFGAATWGQGEAILRFQAGPVHSGQPTDYFAPSNWQILDAGDIDLGGSGPVLVDVPGATPSQLVVGLGKNGVAYLVDRNNLGGIGKGNGTTGEGLASMKVANGAIINAAATYTTANGVFLVLHVHSGNPGAGCPAGQSGDLVALKIGAASPPTLSVAWCANNQGQGSPIATTTDGHANALVWTAGAEGSKHLHAFDGETGAVVYAGGGAGDVMANQTRRFNSPIAVKGRIFVAADNALYAFKSQ